MQKIPTRPNIHFCEKNVERVGNTQNTPIQKSATAKFARKKLVKLRSLALFMMANNTITLPVKQTHCVDRKLHLYSI